MEFNSAKEYDLEVGNISFDGIPTQILHQLYTDGGRWGAIADEWIITKFNNLTLHIAGGVRFIYDEQCRLWELRSLTKHGASLVSTSQIGAGRKANVNAYATKLAEIYGYIVIDITNFPKVHISSITSKQIITAGSPTKLSVTKLAELRTT
jgi:hypothetical protein